MGRRSARACAFTIAACVALLAAQGCAGSARAPAAQRPARPPVPILMYHVIGDVPADARLPALFVSPAQFRAQVKALEQGGYRAVTMRQVWNAWHHGARLPRRPVVLSFDDGSEGQVRHALPALRRAGWPGVLNLAWVFLPAIGGESAVRSLVDAGWEVDSHTLNHPDLTQLDDDGLRQELTESRSRIRDAFGPDAADFFAYPSGRYDGRVKRAVRAAGYLAATTVKAGFAKPTTDPYALPRIGVSRGTSGAALLRRLRDLRP